MVKLKKIKFYLIAFSFIFIGAGMMLFFKFDYKVALGSLIFFGLGLLWFSHKLQKYFNDEEFFIRQTNRFLNNIAGTGEQILGSCTQVGESTSEQSGAVIQTSTASDEISAMIHKSSNNISNVNDSIKLIKDIVEKSNQSTQHLAINFQKSIQANDKVIHLLNKTTDDLTKLIEQFSEVVNKTAVINDIVFQTKLLSFNASVEAARAGEHGKGFSVVAEEIGNLASMSGESATGIQQTLEVTESTVKNIIEEIRKSGESLSHTLKRQNEETKNILGEFNTNFSEVNSKIGNIVGQVDSINTASNEQNKGVNEMRDAIHQVNVSIQRNTLVVGQTTSLANVLSNEIEKYQSMFKIKRHETVGDAQMILEEIPWDKKYEIGISAMDDEHQVLLGKINQLIHDMNYASSNIPNSFEDLKNYTVNHFSHEEKYMESIGYESLESHKRVHKNLIESILRFESQLKENKLDKPKLASFLKNWLFTHIMGVDIKYANHSKQHIEKKAA